MKYGLHLGMTARDKQTGFIGKIVAVTEYLFGHSMFGLQAPMHDSKPGDVIWFEAARLEEIAETSESDKLRHAGANVCENGNSRL